MRSSDGWRAGRAKDKGRSNADVAWRSASPVQSRTSFREDHAGPPQHREYGDHAGLPQHGCAP